MGSLPRLCSWEVKIVHFSGSEDMNGGRTWSRLLVAVGLLGMLVGAVMGVVELLNGRQLQGHGT
ncbi:MAG: hypothetical protein ACYC6Y_25265 [Thermoguttaceae bacterium]